MLAIKFLFLFLNLRYQIQHLEKYSMKINFILSLVFTIFSLTAFSQKYSVSPLAEFKGKSNDNKSDVIYYKGKIYSIDISSRKQLAYTANLEKTNFSVSLVQYDGKGTLLKEVKLDEGEDGFGPIIPQYSILNNILYLQYFTYNKDAGLAMHLSPVNEQTAKAELSDPIITINQKNIGLFKLMKFVNDYNIESNISPDGNRMAFVFTTGLTNMYSYAVVDKNMQVIYAGNGEVADEKNVIVGNVVVTNAGDFYAAMGNKVMESKNHYLVQGKEASKQVKSIEIPQVGIRIQTAAVVLGISASAVNIIGVSGEEKSPLISTMYSAPVSTQTLVVGKLKLQEIPAELIKQFDKEGYAGKKGLFPYAKFKAYTLTDGTSVLLGDATRIQFLENRTLTFKGNALLGLFSPTGNIGIGYISKRESYGSSFYNAFYVHNAGDKLHIVYTDSPENLAKPLGEGKLESFYSKRANNLVVASIAGNGSVNRYVIDPKSPAGFAFESGYCASVTKNIFQLSLVKNKVGMSNITTTNFLSLVEIQ